MRRFVLLVLATALAACGQPKPESTSAPATPATPAAPVSAPSPEVIAARIATLPAPYNAGVYDSGRTVFFAQCRSCHTLNKGGVARVGPNLHGVFGRTAGSIEGFKNYSKGLKDSAIVWDAATLDKWSANPREMVAVNNMVFPGLRKEEDRTNLIAYLVVETTD